MRVPEVVTPPDYPGAPVTVADALAEGRSLRSPRWGIPDALIAFALQVVVAAGAGFALANAGMASAWTVVIGTLLGWAAMIAWIAVRTARAGNGMRIDLGLRFHAADLRTGLAAGFLALAVGVIVGAITMAVTGAFSSAAGDVLLDMVDGGDTAALLAFMIMVGIGAPIVEEIFTRGLLFASLRKRGLSAFWTVIVTSLVFAIAHFEPVRLPLIIAMALVLGIARARSGSTGVAIVGHAVNNGVQVILVLFLLRW